MSDNITTTIQGQNKSNTILEHIPPEKQVPLVDIAITKILERFEQESWGIDFSHETLKNWLGITIHQKGTRKEIDKENMDYLTGIQKITNILLEDYNLCLHSIHSYGYKILHPANQINEGADRHMKKAQKALTRHAKILVNTDISELNVDQRNLQMSKINRIAFLKSAFRKRHLPQPNTQKSLT